MSRWLAVRIWIDRTLAVLAGVLAAPFVAVLVALVRRRDGGPGLITVPRTGRDGTTFSMWKIRSMRVDGPEGRACGVSLTSGHDDRITPIGRRLRALHLDELPQLLNVVRGEMCLLGPRPEAPEFVDLTDPRWQRVLATPPGMAGPTQLLVADWERERIDADVDGSIYLSEVVPVKLAIDEWYVRSASLRIDLVVASSLVRRIATGRTPVALEAIVSRAVAEAIRPIDWARSRRG